MKRYFLFLTLALTALFIASGNLRAESETAETKIRHIKVGEIDFYCIEDAPLEIGNDLLLTEDKELLKRLAPTGKSPSSFGLFLVKKGPDTVLIDTGTGGDMLKHLQALGVKPEDIKTVLLTHSHGDHVGGLVKDGQKVFPNAKIRLSEKEFLFWKSAQNKELCEQVVKLYGEPEFLTPDEKTNVVFPEMVAAALPGHTPGHTGFLIASKGEKLFLVADLLHAGLVQFAEPGIKFFADNDPEQAVETRRKTMKRAAEENLLFVGSHLPFPCAGHVKIDGDAFRFVPIDERTFYGFTVKDIDGKDFSFDKLEGKKVMVVNVASKCGLTPQYKELQELYKKYGGEKFTIIAFPANDFGKQEPGADAEIKDFCTKNYGVTFPVMSKIFVTGEDIHPLYRWLTEKNRNGLRDVKMEWNFQKFLIDEQGNLVDVVPPREKPNSEKVLKWLE